MATGMGMGKTTAEMEKDFNESSVGIDCFIEKNSGKFDSADLSVYLSFLFEQVNVRRRGLSYGELKKYKIADYGNLTESVVYSLFNGSRENPNRDTVIKLCFGMGLTSEEANRLLRKAGKSELYIRNERDCIILFFLKQFEQKVAEDLLLTECNIKLKGYGFGEL
jgi:hypothetical protein